MAYLGAVLWAVALTSLLLVALVLGAARNQRRSIDGQRRKREAAMREQVSRDLESGKVVMLDAGRLARLAKSNQGRDGR